jgi:hypothetical protein
MGRGLAFDGAALDDPYLMNVGRGLRDEGPAWAGHPAVAAGRHGGRLKSEGKGR